MAILRMGMSMGRRGTNWLGKLVVRRLLRRRRYSGTRNDKCELIKLGCYDSM